MSDLSISVECPPSVNLPDNFPDVEMPRFLYGDRLCWLSDGEVSDWGIVIGRFYSFASHCDRWAWCYLLWLGPASPSAAWLSADIAWEEDLQPMEGKEISGNESVSLGFDFAQPTNFER